MLAQTIEKERKQLYNKGIEKGMEKGIEKGVEKGMEKGIEQNKIKIAKNMLAEGLEIPLISKLTGLSQEKALELKSEI